MRILGDVRKHVPTVSLLAGMHSLSFFLTEARHVRIPSSDISELSGPSHGTRPHPSHHPAALTAPVEAKETVINLSPGRGYRNTANWLWWPLDHEGTASTTSVTSRIQKPNDVKSFWSANPEALRL